MNEELTTIVAAVSAAVAAIGTLIARYQETDPKKPWWRRLAKVLDLTQVIDSTRKLGD
jgi:hypothetical protein